MRGFKSRRKMGPHPAGRQSVPARPDLNPRSSVYFLGNLDRWCSVFEPVSLSVGKIFGLICEVGGHWVGVACDYLGAVATLVLGCSSSFFPSAKEKAQERSFRARVPLAFSLRQGRELLVAWTEHKDALCGALPSKCGDFGGRPVGTGHQPAASEQLHPHGTWRQ